MIKLNGNKTYNVRGINFEIRPEKFMDKIRLLGIAKSNSLTDKQYYGAIGLMSILLRVVAWDDGIVDQNDTPLPCTDENKELLFGQQHDLLKELADEIAKSEDRELKNSETSSDGSGSQGEM